MSGDDQARAVVNWAKRHDHRVDPANPNAGLSGFALFQDRGALNLYCAFPGHSDEHINSLAPAG